MKLEALGKSNLKHSETDENSGAHRKKIMLKKKIERKITVQSRLK